MRIWTEAARAAQREAIKRWQPWTKSTGPRTIEGKRKVSTNARKADRPSIKSIRTLRAALQAQSRCRRAFEALAHWQNEKKSEKRTIMMVYLHRVFTEADRAFMCGLLDWRRLHAQESVKMWPVMSPEMKIAA